MGEGLMASYKALQNEAEHARFAEILKTEGVTSYLEIGSKFGGSFRRVGDALPKGSRMVAVDLPGGTKDWAQTRVSLLACIADLKDMGHDARVIWGDSTARDVVEQVRALGPYDCVFIDGNHTAPYIAKDWNNYGAMSNKIVALHDISWKRPADFASYRIDVPEFWNELKSGYRHEEIKMEEKDNGIGVLWKV
jgi:predicted O-methyltransferase YrrM